ncbi:diguanylate cyclase/phosphodiesterase [Psychromonas ingrahamii 37]|uniref:Diguanylate cyclase/phosphodiesterase n=1 Tax=Psychromonas ingrahamii (strain DSM 17664 / CCUG 51855 / 37) TaxID=357804 RepID=A1SUV1_PSYIN|nr:EAL domain-containing protein [Psychromonas ingrahamii]ABM03266.1 diguanylate cyclase/phosphodiesterase [Psychromonas ingrahamii 37]
MTLFKQINSLLLGLFLLVMSTLFYFQFTETSAFMSDQMESDLNNTSISLGLMLKPHLETGDVVMVETLINVIFEGGFYQRVSLTWLADQKQQVWKNPVIINGVPQWFVNLGLFKGLISETVITSGWLQLATLKIESNPAIGYRELWRIMKHMVLALVVIFLIAIFLFRWRLKTILKPVDQVAAHAYDLARCKFSENLPLPKTTELKKMVDAVNTMSGQLKLVFNSLAEQVNILKNETLFDAVSQLPNRQYLAGQLTSRLDQPGVGALILAKFPWLDEIHHKFGYQVRDQAIKKLSDNLLKSLPKSFIARISNTEFAFLIMDADDKQITYYLQLLIRLINQEILQDGCIPNRDFAIGLSERTANVTPAELLAQADHALQKALLENKISQWFRPHTEQEFSLEQWRVRLLDVINKHQFIFQWQMVHSMESDSVMQREIYSRLKIDEKVTQANEFIPFVERLALGHQFDRNILEALVKRQLLTINKEPIAVNLTRDSIVNNEFHTWLSQFLNKVADPHLIHFELPEAGVLNYLEEAIRLSDIIKIRGAKCGIDHYGQQLTSFEYLRLLKPYYVKLDLSLSAYQDQEKPHNLKNLEICRALVNIAHGFDIKVIITGIEDEKHLKMVKILRIEGYQGYISGPVDI